LALQANRPVSAVFRSGNIVECLGGEVDGEFAKVHDFAKTSADGNNPDITRRIGRPVRSDDRRKREIPAAGKVVVEKRLEGHGIDVLVPPSGEGPDIVDQGPGNDVVYLFNKVFTTPSNSGLLANYILSGYLLYDINLDGNSIYQGPGNDSAKVLFNAVLSTPENIMQLANFILLQKLP